MTPYRETPPREPPPVIRPNLPNTILALGFSTALCFAVFFGLKGCSTWLNSNPQKTCESKVISVTKTGASWNCPTGSSPQKPEIIDLDGIEKYIIVRCTCLPKAKKPTNAESTNAGAPSNEQ